MSIQIEQTGPIAWATLVRPQKANALNRETVEALLRALDRVEADADARILAIRGAGTHFCAGGDLAEVLAGGAAALRGFLDRVRELFGRLERSPLLTIATVHGAVRAGGLELALSCDLIVAAKSATFGDAHLANGLLPGGGSTARLPRAIGWQRAKWLILSGASVDAATAEAWGLVHEIVEDAGRLADAVGRVSDTFAQVDREALGRTKKLLAMSSEQPLGASLEAEIAALEAHYHSAAFQRGIQRFLDRKRGAHDATGRS